MFNEILQLFRGRFFPLFIHVQCTFCTSSTSWLVLLESTWDESSCVVESGFHWVHVRPAEGGGVVRLVMQRMHLQLFSTCISRWSLASFFKFILYVVLSQTTVVGLGTYKSLSCL
jgi:hypothetical protein